MQSLHRVEKSPSLMVRAALRWEISRLRVSWARFPSAPYRHAVPLEMTMVAAPLSSFRPKRSGVEKSHSTMVQEALGWEISRLRVSSMRFPSAPYRHAALLEMTVLASAPIVISTEAKRSGEISLLNSPGSMEAGNLSAQSPHRAPHTGPLPARDDQGQPLTFMEPE